MSGMLERPDPLRDNEHESVRNHQHEGDGRHRPMDRFVASTLDRYGQSAQARCAKDPRRYSDVTQSSIIVRDV